MILVPSYLGTSPPDLQIGCLLNRTVFTVCVQRISSTLESNKMEPLYCICLKFEGVGGGLEGRRRTMFRVNLMVLSSVTAAPDPSDICPLK